MDQLSDASRINILSSALRDVRDRNNARRSHGLYDSEVQRICRAALKRAGDETIRETETKQ